MDRSRFERTVWAAALIILVALLVYSNTWKVPFVLDDTLCIVRHDLIRALENYFANASGYAESPTRYIGQLTFALNYRLGGLDVTGYHAVNVAIHVGCALLVYALLLLTLETPCFSAGGVLVPHLRLLPLFSALLFAVHPIQTQAVTYVAQRFTSLCTLFYLGAVVLYALARVRGERASLRPDVGASGAVWPLIGATLSAVLAMKTKEVAVTLPFAVLLYEACFFSGAWKRRLVYPLPVLATLPIVPLSVLYRGVGATADLAARAGSQLRAQSDISRVEYLFTQFGVVVEYLRLLVLPVGQNLDYDRPVLRTFFSAPVILPFTVLLALGGVALYLYLASRPGADPIAGPSFPARRLSEGSRPFARLVAFGIFWFFLALSVESTVIPIADVIAEHRLYLPSVGAAFAVVGFCALVSVRIASPVFRRGLVAAGVLCVLVLSLAAYARNRVWRSEVVLWQDVVSKSPNKVSALNNLGMALNQAGRPDEAIPFLVKAISLAWWYHNANYNLAKSYMSLGEWRSAEPLLRRALMAKPDFWEAYSDLSAVLIGQERYREAATLLEQNLSLLQGVPEARFNLGVAYVHLGDTQAARRELAAVYQLKPELAPPLRELLE